MTWNAREEYEAALKEGQKEYARLTGLGKDPGPAVLEELLPDIGKLTVQELPAQEIPMDRIAGTRTRGRTSALTAGFLPLLPEESEFAQKWMSLCDANLSDTGIRDPILCYEYLGNFYVQEGNKRVSVLKHFGTTRIMSEIRRVLPEKSDDPRIRAYYEFVDFHRLSGSYEVQLQKPGEYARLLSALDKKPGEVWTEEERRRFSARYHYFKEAFAALGGQAKDLKCEDALLLWLRVYPYEQLSAMTAKALKESLLGLWGDVQATADAGTPQVRTVPEEEQQKSLITKLISPAPKRLNIAMIYQQDEEISTWTRGHAEGAAYLKSVLGEQVTVREYRHADTPEETLALLDRAAEDGADLVFTTTPLLLGPTLKAAVKYPKVRFLNCSAGSNLSSVRSYYCRIYEGKFITGLIAGAMAKNDLIGYVASYPILGVPASINAFALGARMTNPRARVLLEWSSVKDTDIDEHFARFGVAAVSGQDSLIRDERQRSLGLFLQLGGKQVNVANSFWNWGSFYKKILESVLDGSWADLNSTSESGQTINYWWGLSSGVVDVRLGDRVPAETARLVKLLRQEIADGRFRPFDGPVYDQHGELRIQEGEVLTPLQILQMDWLVENVNGEIPTIDRLTPQAQELVKIQGVKATEPEA